MICERRVYWLKKKKIIIQWNGLNERINEENGVRKKKDERLRDKLRITRIEVSGKQESKAACFFGERSNVHWFRINNF